MALSDFPPFLTDNDPASNFAAYTRAVTGSWQILTLASGIAHQGGDKMSYRREGGRVFFRWGISGTGIAANSNVDLGSVVSSCRPPSSRYCPGVLGASGNVSGGLVINAAGVVSFRNGATTSSYYLFDGVSFDLG